MEIPREKLRLRLRSALAVLALVKFWIPEQRFAQGQLVVAIQPAVFSDEMLKKAQPLGKFLRDGLDGKTDVQICLPNSFAAAAQG